MTLSGAPALLAVPLVAAAAIAGIACGAGTPSSTPTVPARTPLLSPTPTASSSPAPSPASLSSEGTSLPVDRIAYVGEDNQIYTISPDGTGTRRITPVPTEERGPYPEYTWPTWSPDARSLVISAVVPNPQSRVDRLVVYLADEASPENGLRAIHQDRAGSEGILPGVFHYAIWSPSGDRVAIIAVGQTDLAVFISRLDDEPTTPIIGGSPMYLTWSWDSDRIFVHQSERLMMFNLANGDPARSLGASTRYQAPVAANNPRGRLAYVVDGSDGSSEVVVSEVDGSNRVNVTRVPHLTAIQWAPDGRRLAIGRTAGQDSGGDPFSYAELLIADIDTGRVRSVAERSIFAFEWSPDGHRMLIAERLTDDVGVFRWSVLNVDDGSVKQLVDVRPTDEFGLMLVYFDQYTQSHRLWSPDGGHFVLCGEMLDSGAPPLGETLERVWVVDADGSDAPRPIAEGYLAFWSPR